MAEWRNPGTDAVGRNFTDMRTENSVADRQVDKAGPSDFKFDEGWIDLEPFDNGFRDLTRIFFSRFGRSHRAVALELSEIGTVGDTHQTKGRIETFGSKGSADILGQFLNERWH